VVAYFEAGTITSDAGALLLREIEAEPIISSMISLPVSAISGNTGMWNIQ